MKKTYSYCLFAFLIAGIFGFRSISDWIEYKSEVGNYKVTMPGTPEEQIKKLPTAVGEITMHIAMVQSEENDDNLLYLSAYSEYPAEKISSEMSKDGIDRFFNGAADGGAKSMNGKLISITDTVYKNYPAKNVLIDANIGGQNFLVLQKLILIKNKFYMLQTFTKPEMEGNPNARKFFESFKRED
ncbi:MAG: hypothetical protein ACKVOW_14840 [Chitinophagaceae bacterium]